jgi:hypothetical protein
MVKYSINQEVIFLKNYVYVDFENLSNLKSFARISGKYIFFIGSTQNKISSDLIVSSNNINVDWIRIDGNGKNALDFYIAYYLSKYDSEKDVNHFILSKDTGFDPLIKHLSKKGVSVQRIITLEDINRKKSSSKKNSPKNYEACVKNLTKITKAKRPKSVKTLTSHLMTILEETNEQNISLIIDEMYRNKFISSGQNKRIKYLD